MSMPMPSCSASTTSGSLSSSGTGKLPPRVASAQPTSSASSVETNQGRRVLWRDRSPTSRSQIAIDNDCSSNHRSYGGGEAASVACQRLGGFGFAEPAAERLEEPDRDVRVLLQEVLEAPFRDGRQPEVGFGDDGRRAPFVVEQRHLAEVVEGPQLADSAVGRVDFGIALQDDHEADATAAFDHDLGAGVVAD